MALTGLAFTAQQRAAHPCYTKIFIFIILSEIFLLMLSPIQAEQELSPSDSLESAQDKICETIDIRNSLDAFARLENCVVVEGYVQILLIDSVDENALANISFPKLTEITDYLLLYRVNGLRSIGQLFPNLAVIRGQNLFLHTYAFVVYEMSSLQEIALHSLTHISNGQVRFDKNPSLCFLNSIDWKRIVQDKNADTYIPTIRRENECPICPGDEKIPDGSGKPRKSCPKSHDDSGRERSLCWNRQHCQRICPKGCEFCNNKMECCDKACLGGCSDENPKICSVCRNLSIGIGANRQCVNHCPANQYKFLYRRCVSREDCIQMSAPIDHPQIISPKPYKIHNDSCVLHCGPDYMNDDKNHSCIPCNGKCKKECPGTNVDSISVANTLKGCTHITSSLEIQIRGGSNVVSVLEENLGMIEEIDGYLKVVRSFPLISLNFLKNLKRIRGKTLESQRYVFIVLDNQNLVDLWDWKDRELKIDRGSLFFHFNPKLCINKIELLKNKTGLPPFTDMEVALNSNGDKVACDVKDLNVTVVKIAANSVILGWNPFTLDDPRKLLGYIIYSTEAPYRNVTLYDGRDACGGDNWNVLDDNNRDSAGTLLTGLKPYTQYAVYVKTYTIATEKTGAQSKILYFRTKPSKPSEPKNLKYSSKSSDSITITWQEPKPANGNITHYIINGRKKERSTENLQRDYCINPPSDPPKSNEIDQTTSIISTPATVNGTCSCPSEKQPSLEEKEQLQQAKINFEDALQNQVYIRRQTRKRRDVDDQTKEFPKLGSKDNSTISFPFCNSNITENGTEIWESFCFKAYDTKIEISNLHHYTSYYIDIAACREPVEGDEEKDTCSERAGITTITQKKDGADNISNVHISNQSLDSVTLTWDHPLEPNGIIYRYSIEYKRIDMEHGFPSNLCVPREKFTNGTQSHVINKLAPGKYRFRVMATTSAGDGQWSPEATCIVKEYKSNNTTIAIVAVILVFIILLIILYIIYKLINKEKENRRLIPSVNPEYVPSVYVPDEWEVPRKNIELIKELGQGSFGMVYEGITRDIKGKPFIRCAIKTVNEHATNRERLEFLNEASVMKAFDTAHVVRLLGVVSQGQPTLVIMEYMANADLKSYLRSHRPDNDSYDAHQRHPPTLKQIYQMAIEIADGMAYLSAKKFVHRDLAARNCMVAEDLTVKIGDFGMTRDIYETDYYRKGTKGLLPVRWMAPESLKDGVFSSYSDVWSYGVVLWEMSTLGSQPYQGLSNDQVLRYVIDGGVMERPENCPDKLYNLMRMCWEHDPAARPPFLKLCSILLDDANPNFSQVSFYHSAAGIEARASRPTPSPLQDDPTTPLRKASELSYSHSDSRDSDNELGIDTTTHIQFASISEGKAPTANGYVSGNVTNGAATTQC